MKPRRTPEQAEAITAALIGLDEQTSSLELKWGVGRLVCLVSETTRASYRRGWLAWREAEAKGDADSMLAIIPKMQKLQAMMDAEATKLGAQPLASTVWEAQAPDGSVIAVVRTRAEASAVAREGRAISVYCLDEVARLLRRTEIVDAIKLEFPGATVERVIQLGEGYAESWATSDPLHDLLHGASDIDVQAHPEAVG